MFVCPAENLFRFEKVAEMGYAWQLGFYSGDIDPMTISWRGDKGLQWDEMKSLVYKNTTDFTHYFFDDKWYAANNNHSRIDLWPTVKCTEIRNISTNFGFETKSGLDVIIIDPALQPSYRRVQRGISGELFSSGSTKMDNPVYEEVLFTIKTSY